MQVDNSPLQPSYFASGSANSSYTDYPADLSEIFDTDLFNKAYSSSLAGPSSSPSMESRGSTPQNLLTPPQEPLPTSFPDIHDGDDSNPTSIFYSMFGDDLKSIDNPLAMPSSSPDYMGVTSIDGAFGADMPQYPYGLSTYPMPMDFSSMVMNTAPTSDAMQRGINPQLVDTPSAISDHGDDDSDEQEPQSPPVEKKEPEKLTVTIAPVKVGGHGKARKGTVQSGGVVKKSSVSAATKEKENAIASLAAKKIAKPIKTSSPSSSAPSPSHFLTGNDSIYAGSEAGDLDDDAGDDIPQDWRPPPEVLAKMSSKEKRQLRNKISARNFRVRRKEYISTLEGDIAERDRLLDHFRTQLGSRESENIALRQEIAALKKALLDGRGGPINLPPPAPLPQQSAAEQLAASASASSTVPAGLSTPSRTSTPLLTPNTQKDLPTSPRLGARFWGGVGMGSGITPVHTTLVPDVSTILRKGLQENINPALNGPQPGLGSSIGANKGLSGFDGFADLNPFTMKTLDAYRMHLWGKMAAQQHMHAQSQAQGFAPHQQSSLASKLPALGFSANPAKAPLAPSNSLSALLSGKHSGSAFYPTPPASPSLNPKSLPSSISPKERELQQQREKDQQNAMLAAMASQTLFRKLGSAFWDAFTGSSGSSSSSGHGNWDQDKVQRVLEGKAVLKVVDVEPPTPTTFIKPFKASSLSGSSAPSTSSPALNDDKKCCSASVVDLLEESMRSLTVTKKT